MCYPNMGKVQQYLCMLMSQGQVAATPCKTSIHITLVIISCIIKMRVRNYMYIIVLQNIRVSYCNCQDSNNVVAIIIILFGVM